MSIRVIMTCDRCNSDLGAMDGQPEPDRLPDLEVSAPWLPRGIPSFQDLCDDCRTTVAGYLASALKVDRDTIYTGRARTRNKAGIVPPPTLPLEPATDPLMDLAAEVRAERQEGATHEMVGDGLSVTNGKLDDEITL